MRRSYGWRPDVPDYRDVECDHTFVGLAAPFHAAVIPAAVNLEPQCTPVCDQGELGSCTGNAWAAALDFALLKAGAKPIGASRLFIYYNERLIEGTVRQDAGSSIRDGVKTLAKQGACPEAKWPYIISKFRTKPSAACYSAALKDRAVTYARVNNSSLVALQGVLASGFPIVLGFSVYESFESQAVAKTGIVPMPTLHESLLGGHAVMCVGYDDAIKRFRVRNSWGAEWGQKGYFEIPYDYLTNLNLADDFWVLKLVG